MTTYAAHLPPRDWTEPPVPRRGFLERITSAERASIRLLGRDLHIPTGERLTLQGDPVDRVLILTSGHAKLTRTSTDGHDTVLAIRDPGELIGHQVLTGSTHYDATTTALTDIDALAICRTAFTAHLDRTPRLLLAILQTVSDECAELSDRCTEYTRLDTLGRVANCLTDLADRYGEPRDHSIAITLPIRQEDLAAWAGASRAGTAKALQTLRQLGWIRTSRTQIVIDNPRALRQRAS